jgi:hypothetical protein
MMTLDLSDRPWWKEPMVWLIVGLPATAVVASIATYFIAAHDPDSLVRADYRKEGFALVEKTTQADRLAAELGLVARMAVNNGKLELDLKSRLDTVPARVSLTIIHPTQESQDIHLLLEPSGAGSYVATAPDVGSGKRILVLEPEDRAWRITGRSMAPFSGITELAAVVKNPSTPP